MANKKYKLTIWILGSLMAAAFAYYFITIFFFAGARYFKTEIKLTAQEKQMIDEFETDCDCEVKFHHNYDLIKNTTNNSESIDSTLSLSFTLNTGSSKKKISFCEIADSILIANATQMATRLMKTVHYKDYYTRVNIVYLTYDKSNIKSKTCYKTVECKLDKWKNIEFVHIK